jgi:hypothetical protein
MTSRTQPSVSSAEEFSFVELIGSRRLLISRNEIILEEYPFWTPALIRICTRGLPVIMLAAALPDLLRASGHAVMPVRQSDELRRIVPWILLLWFSASRRGDRTLLLREHDDIRVSPNLRSTARLAEEYISVTKDLKSITRWTPLGFGLYLFDPHARIPERRLVFRSYLPTSIHRVERIVRQWLDPAPAWLADPIVWPPAPTATRKSTP